MSALVIEGRKIQPLRGRVVIVEQKEKASDLLWTPPKKDRDEKIHTGRVLAFGAPARTAKGIEVPPDFKIGDQVLFVWTHLEKGWSQQWGSETVALVPQESVVAVIDR